MSYYEVLGVAPDASDVDVRRAYRAAVKRSHPDGGGTVADFASVRAAYDVLGDPDRRRAYDVRNQVTAASAPPPPRGQARADGRDPHRPGQQTRSPAAAPSNSAPPTGTPRSTARTESASAQASAPSADGRAGALESLLCRLTQLRGSPWATGGLAALTAVLGTLCAVTIGLLGQVAAAAAAAYLVTVALLMGWRWRGGVLGASLMPRLLAGSMVLAGLWVVVAVGSGATGGPVVAPVLFALNAAGFAAAGRALYGTIGPRSSGEAS